MSDYDRNKYFRRTKFYPTPRDSSHPTHYGTRPYSKNTLFKYDREYKETDKPNENKEKTIQQPTILLKARNERSVSPKRSTKENEPPPTPTTATAHDNACLPPRVMCESIKLIDDTTLCLEVIQEYLQDSPDFLVVGVLGGQGVGKSTVMNLIAQNVLTNQFKSDLFSYSSNTNSQNATESIKILTDNISNVKFAEEETKTESSKELNQNNIIFKPQTLEQIQTGNYATNGVDMYITSNRVFLLDCQPMMSSANLDEIVQNEFKKITAAGDFVPLENCAEIQSLIFATFLLSVCHVVVVVQDWFFDSNFIRFLHTAEMLKPSIPTAEDDYMEYFPHVILVHNRATMEDFTPIRFKTMQQVYQELFSKSKLRFDSGMGLGTGKIMHCLNPTTCGDPLNLFLLPEYEDTKDLKYRGHPPFEDLIREFRSQIHSVTRIPMLSAQLSERNWLQFASRVWDTIRKSTFFIEYSKLMP